MPLPLQLPSGSVVLSNRFGEGPFADCECFVRVLLPQGVEVEGVYNAPRGVQPERYWLYCFALRRGEPSHTVGQRWAPSEKGAAAMLASVARTIHRDRRPNLPWPGNQSVKNASVIDQRSLSSCGSIEQSGQPVHRVKGQLPVIAAREIQSCAQRFFPARLDNLGGKDRRFAEHDNPSLAESEGEPLRATGSRTLLPAGRQQVNGAIG
jgi:hypothetical protein